MLKEKNSLYIMSIILILLGLLFIIYYFIDKRVEYSIEIDKINDYINYTSIENNVIISDDNDTNNEIDYNMIIEIPKIDLKKGIYNINSSYNNVDYNIEVLKESIILDNDINSLILASHNGNSKVSYFKYLNKLNINDEVYIYYNGNKFIYEINNIYDLLKDGDVEISKENNSKSLTLITCKDNTSDRQLVIIAYLKSIEKY